MNASRFATLVLALAFGAALARVLTLDRAGATREDRKVIRIAHWQLESGVRQGLDAIASEYAKVRPDVVVQQIPISERGFTSWMTTRLIGGTAPEVIEIGLTADAQTDQLLLRYFEPLSEEIGKPNPYNRGTPLEKVPWKDTFYDGMQGGFVPSLLDYFSVPSSAFTVRLFYNRTKLREVTGLDRPPSEFRAFLAMCDRILATRDPSGRSLVPIAGAGRYNTGILFGRYDIALTSTLFNKVDTNFDGEAVPDEYGTALVNGSVSFRDPRIEATFRVREHFLPLFQPAFYQADRMDAAFLFIQQKALMIASGAWDAASYVRQADFEVGVCNFPMPSPSDPEFGKFAAGDSAEDLSGAFRFGLNRRSPLAAEALDFLKFMSSQRMNDLLNRHIQWIPMVRGNLPAPFIEPFWPQMQGVRRGMDVSIGARNQVKNDKLMNLFACRRITFDDYLREYVPTFVRNTDEYYRMDRAREVRLAQNQGEFRLAYERAMERLGKARGQRARAISEAEIFRTFNFFEVLRRYETARASTRLPAD